MDKLRLSELFEEKAKRFLEGAKSAMNYGDYSGAVYKAYYSIFHLSKAYLFLLGEEYPLAWTNIPFVDIYPHLGFRD